MGVSDKPYPYNVLLAHWDAHRLLNQANQAVELDMVQDDDGNIRLATSQTFNVGDTLYYVPVIPLYRLLKGKGNRREGELLLSVFSYLYHIGGVPYYTDEGSETFGYYAMMKEWVLDDMDGMEEEAKRKRVSRLREAEYCGSVMHRKLGNLVHLNQFGERVERFKPESERQKQVLKVGKMAYALFVEFPLSNIFRHIGCAEEEEGNDDGYGSGVVRGGQYISFVADTKGMLFEMIADMINCEFSECAIMEQPTIVQVFGSHATEIANLNFERGFFYLINELCSLLYDMP
jgi:hypothetical protein